MSDENEEYIWTKIHTIGLIAIIIAISGGIFSLSIIDINNQLEYDKERDKSILEISGMINDIEKENEMSGPDSIYFTMLKADNFTFLMRFKFDQHISDNYHLYDNMYVHIYYYPEFKSSFGGYEVKNITVL